MQTLQQLTQKEAELALKMVAGHSPIKRLPPILTKLSELEWMMLHKALQILTEEKASGTVH